MIEISCSSEIMMIMVMIVDSVSVIICLKCLQNVIIVYWV